MAAIQPQAASLDHPVSECRVWCVIGWLVWLVGMGKGWPRAAEGIITLLPGMFARVMLFLCKWLVPRTTLYCVPVGHTLLLPLAHTHTHTHTHTYILVQH